MECNRNKGTHFKIESGILEAKKLIENVSIILNSGQMLYNENFKDQGGEISDKDFLISGLLSALSNLAKEAFGEKIEEIILQNQKIFVKSYEKYFIALTADIRIDPVYVKNVLRQIHEVFSERHDVSEFNGDIDEFKNLAPIIKNIIEENKTRIMRLKDKYGKKLQDELKKLVTLMSKENALERG
ncbi:MAG: hypothetical protein ACTSSI_16380 [Candidatus Helarchaeota archaeon]